MHRRSSARRSQPLSSRGRATGGAADGEAREARWLRAYGEMVQRTARLVAGWHCVGFCPGVLHTDHMSVACHTSDYGPFCFMEPRAQPEHDLSTPPAAPPPPPRPPPRP